MSFQGDQVIDQTTQTVNAILLLNSSCQAMIEAMIEPSSSSWYNTLNNLLGASESLIIDWRKSGYLYFYNTTLSDISNCAQVFLDNADTINALLNTTKGELNDNNKTQLINALETLNAPIDRFSSTIEGYESALADLDKNMQSVLNDMQSSIAEIQNEEAALKSEIDTINQYITNLKKQIKTDREAIAKAKSERTKGIVETIFGVVLAPVTFGGSLVLAGIGVSSIVEAEDKIDDMQSDISSYQQKISGEQAQLSDDEKEVSTLNGLAMSADILVNDINFITLSIDPLRTSWQVLSNELAGCQSNIEKAESADDIVLVEAWFNSACAEMSSVVTSCNAMLNQNVSSSKVSIG